MRCILHIARLAIVAACLTAVPIVATAQPYPNRSIHLVVGFPPGGINDIVARIIGQKMSESLGQPVVVENRPGAGGTIGADWVSKAKPDGYTLLLGSVSNLAMAPISTRACRMILQKTLLQSRLSLRHRTLWW